MIRAPNSTNEKDKDKPLEKESQTFTLFSILQNSLSMPSLTIQCSKFKLFCLCTMYSDQRHFFT